MATRATRGLTRAASDRRAQVAAGTLAAVGAGAVAGKVAMDHLHEDNGTKGKSRAYRLKGKEPPTKGIRRIALGRADKAAEELNDARNGSDFAASVHAARKDLKKLRGVLRLVRGELGERVYRAENQRYRDAGRRLAQSRDAEVKTETLSALRERFDEELFRFRRRLACRPRARARRDRRERL